MPDRNLELALRIRAAVQGADNIEDLRRQFDDLIDELQRGEEQAGETDRAFGGLTSGLGNLGDAMQTLAGLAILQQFVQINREAESLRNTLTALFGSVEKSAQEIQYLNETANRLGVAVGDISQSYIGLTTASKGTNLEGQKTREIFEAVVGAMAVMGKTGQEADQALTAIAQTMGKGVIQAEELTGQLEEALPGASRALAAALGVTVAELRQMVETGTVVSADVLPALAAELKKTYGASAEGANTLNAQLARLQNAVTQVFTQIGESGALTAFKEGTVIAAVGVRELYGGLELTGTAIGALAAAVANLDFSQFNRTMQDTSDKLTREVAAIAQYSDTLGPLFAKSAAGAKALADAQDQVAGKTTQAAQAAEQAGGSLTKLQFRYQQRQDELEKTLSLLNKQAAAQKGWADVLQAEAELRGDIVRQTELAIAVAEKDAATKQEQATASARAAGEAQRYAAALASQADVIPQVLEAAEKDAIAKQKEADATAVAAAAASQQAEAVRAANIVILDTLGQQGESAEAARDKAAQLRAEYEAMKSAGAPLAAIALKMNEVVKAEDAARIAARGYREEQAITIQQLDALRAKLDGSLGSQVAYNTALEKFVLQQHAASEQIERRNRLLEDARQADIGAVRAAADLAEARGNEAEASRLRNAALEQELGLAREQYFLRVQEKRALEDVLSAKEREADADGVRIQAELEGLQVARDAVAAKNNDIKAAESAIATKEAEIIAARRLAAEIEHVTEIQARNAQVTRDNAETLARWAAETEASGEAVTGVLSEWARRLNELSPAAREAFDGFNREGEKARDTALSIADALDGLAAGGFVRWANETAIKALQIEQAFRDQADAADDLVAQLDAVADGGGRATGGLDGLIAQAESARQNLDLLDKTRLDDLQQAIDRARGSMDSLRQASEDALDAAQRALLQQQGDKEALLELDRKRQLLELERQLADARNAGDQQAIANLEQALNLQEKTYDLKRKQLEQDQRQSQNETTRSAPSAPSAPSSSGGGGITVNVNANNARLLDNKFVEDLARQMTPVLGGIQRRLA